MLLVHHDQAEARDGREHGAARPEHHVGLPLAHPAVLGGALGGGERRVPHGHAGPQAGAQAAQQLRGERDLRHQHDGPHPPRTRRLDRVEVHLRLAPSPVTPCSRCAPPSPSIAATIAATARSCVGGQRRRHRSRPRVGRRLACGVQRQDAVLRHRPAASAWWCPRGARSSASRQRAPGRRARPPPRAGARAALRRLAQQPRGQDARAAPRAAAPGSTTRPAPSAAGRPPPPGGRTRRRHVAAGAT